MIEFANDKYVNEKRIRTNKRTVLQTSHCNPISQSLQNSVLLSNTRAKAKKQKIIQHTLKQKQIKTGGITSHST